ncbi:MAG TPA: glycosyltransferase, partial [Herpetosiphonaceae bacterium]
MHLVILTIGTLGDVQPYVALGRGLVRAGYRVTVATSARFAALVTQAGLGHRVLPVDFLELVQTPEGQRALAGGNKLALMQRIMPLLRAMLDAGWAVTADADAVLYHPKALAGEHCAEVRGIPGMLVHPIPLASPTGAFPTPLAPLPPLGAWLNRLSHRLLLALSTAPYRRMIRHWRTTTLGLHAPWTPWMRDGAPIPRLYGYSPHVLPVPADWDATTYVSGYWVAEHPADWQPPTALRDFLAAGPPPVYIGFGSMVGADSAQTTALIHQALAAADLRGVVA